MKMDELDKLSTQINNLDLSDEQKIELAATVKQLRKQKSGLDFKIQRTLKDKAIVINVLNTTIKELEKQKILVENQSEQLKMRLKELKHSYNNSPCK